jgi:hypothetical protein
MREINPGCLYGTTEGSEGTNESQHGDHGGEQSGEQSGEGRGHSGNEGSSSSGGLVAGDDETGAKARTSIGTGTEDGKEHGKETSPLYSPPPGGTASKGKVEREEKTDHGAAGWAAPTNKDTKTEEIKCSNTVDTTAAERTLEEEEEGEEGEEGEEEEGEEGEEGVDEGMDETTADMLGSVVRWLPIPFKERLLQRLAGAAILPHLLGAFADPSLERAVLFGSCNLRDEHVIGLLPRLLVGDGGGGSGGSSGGHGYGGGGDGDNGGARVVDDWREWCDESDEASSSEADDDDGESEGSRFVEGGGGGDGGGGGGGGETKVEGDTRHSPTPALQLPALRGWLRLRVLDLSGTSVGVAMTTRMVSMLAHLEVVCLCNCFIGGSAGTASSAASAASAANAGGSNIIQRGQQHVRQRTRRVNTGETPVVAAEVTRRRSRHKKKVLRQREREGKTGERGKKSTYSEHRTRRRPAGSGEGGGRNRGGNGGGNGGGGGGGTGSGNAGVVAARSADNEAAAGALDLGLCSDQALVYDLATALSGLVALRVLDVGGNAWVDDDWVAVLFWGRRGGCPGAFQETMNWAGAGVRETETTGTVGDGDGIYMVGGGVGGSGVGGRGNVAERAGALRELWALDTLVSGALCRAVGLRRDCSVMIR